MTIRFALSVVLCAAAISALHAQQPAIAIRAAGMIDVVHGQRIEKAIVVVQDGRIAAAGSAADVDVPANASIIDLPSTTLLPGLIDAHVHLTLAGPPAENARATLAAGFTTVQDLGAVTYANIALRDAIAAGRVEGPRIVASGPWLGISGGICDFNGIGVKGADAFRKRVREDAEHGADLIKVCVSGWLAEAVADQARYEISDEELRAAIDEAHGLGKRVAVHAISEGGIGVAVRMGADLVVHGGFPSAATIATMRERGVFELPTLFSLSTGKPEHVKALQSRMGQAFAGGLPVAFGTDAGVIPHGENAKEFEHLASIGLDAGEAIRAATVSAARAVGRQKDLGVLAAGRIADVIGVGGNPLMDVRVLEDVRFVMKDGKVVRKE
jgi:imidazolonepropionase-like amidohydrolase